MYAKYLSGFSSNSAHAALADVLAGALSSKKGAASLQVIVQAVTKVGDAWTASVLVLVEPRVEDNAGKKERKLEEGGDNLLERQKEEEEDKRKQHIKDLQLRLEQQFAAQRELMEELDLQLQSQEAVTSIYMDMIFEPVFEPIESAFDFTYIHYIPSGSLWDSVLKHHPVQDMYEAAHNIPKGQEPVMQAKQVLEMKPEPKAGYANGLDDELI